MTQTYTKKLSVFGLAVLGGLLATSGANAQTACGDLFFSEYIEGSSGTNKAIEIYNPTNAAISLTPYSVKFYLNGAAAATATLPLTGSIASGGTIVIANSASDAGIVSVATIQVGSANAATNVANFNGNDAVSLVKMVGTNEVFVDIFGNIGCDPGATGWNNGTTTTHSTMNRALRRKATVNKGISVDPAGTTATTPNNTDCPFPSLVTEWTDHSDTNYSSLGSHTSNCVTGISEELSKAISVYPNPVMSVLNLNLSAVADKNATVSIVNALGQVVKTIPATTTELNVSNFPAGVYTIKIATSNATAVKRFVKFN